MPKILFSDLDGTIIGKNAVPLHEKNIEALHRLRSEGHLVALCTGRNNIDILPTLKQTPIPYDYLVLCNGAYIADKHGKVIWENDIPVKTAKEMLRTFAKEDRLITYFCDGRQCYFKRSDGIGMIDGNGDMHISQNQEDFLQYIEQTYKFTIIGINQEDEKTDFLDDYVKRVLPDFEKEISWFYNTVYIDIMASGATKGSGMMHLADYLGLAKDEIYAIGDSFNDVSMISLAGHGYTFNRSEKDVKKHADKTVDYLYETVDDMLNNCKSHLF